MAVPALSGAGRLRIVSGDPEGMLMATITKDTTAKLQTTKSGDIEERAFKAGEQVRLVQEWQNRYLVKTQDGHYFNLEKDLVKP